MMSFQCLGPNIDIPFEEFPSSMIHQDEDGLEWTLGTCKCEFPLAEAITDIVIQALEKLPNVLCAVALEATKLIVDIGTTFIPGVGQVKTATRMAIEAAKTIAENGLPAADFSTWVASTCKLEDWDFDPVDAFIPLTEMPDSLGESIGCLRKNKKECKKLDPKPDPKPTDKKDDDDGPKPTNSKPDDNNSNPTATKSADTPTDTSCAIGKPGGCGVECSNIDVWGDELISGEPEHEARLPLQDSDLATRGVLAKRDGKDVKLCGIKVETENYPRGKILATVSHDSPSLTLV